MSPWAIVIAMLAGVNLARATGRGVIVAAGLAAVLAASILVGWLVAPPVAAAVSMAAGGLVVASWRSLAVRGGPRRQAAGLAALVTAGALMIVLLGEALAPPSAAWLWCGAFLFLAEPSTRLLRWVMALSGRPLAESAATFGRGEAIGVLERWITAVVVAHGEYGALGFIIAAKALARHKRFETDADFAEYFLIGTLASVLIAVAVAEALRGAGLGWD